MRAQLGPQPGQQDRELEGLGHVIVGARVQPQDRVGIGVVAGQHHDGAFHVQLAQLLAQLASVGVGQAHVQNHQVEDRILGGLDRLGAAARLGHVKVVGRDQLLGQGLAQVLLVVDQQDFFQSGHGCLLLLLRQSVGTSAQPVQRHVENLTWSCQDRALCFRLFQNCVAP